ncbi:autoinducer 2 ABC transporter permease LsrC [Aedoeadaptatus ivorii]|uniref:Autoinducer 2 ABC transporter permease LsrC n=1 Tax=Aedoeadaptatus ivorii TaxID=54006 RepID=A0A3S5C2M8_9FIRM|nr:ABC transporter permease [Peptoniphilus ivorii]MDQ0508182.1 simple sugar transport system permease protein [Peptoniphilus ivorii]VEJ35912.1 autoinducer 2 ABC transporter permease LsrC [Peptoniphilus ivorii]
MNKSFVQKIGLPRLIIGLFLLALFVAAPLAGISLADSVENVLARFGMFSILVLSLIPMVQSGCGLNFGIPIGIVAGILGGVTSMEFGLKGFGGIAVAMLIAAAIAVVFGFGYGVLLNKIKGDEMLIATYVGYSFTAFMCIIYLILPYKNPVSVLSYAGRGLSQQVPVAQYWMKNLVDAEGTRSSVGILTDFLSFRIAGVRIPVGMFLVFAFFAFLVWAFFRTKTGTAMTAVGSNPDYAKAGGIDIDRMRLFSVILSTVIAAVGIIVYQQSYGFIQLYQAPLAFTFQTVAALLIGGASINKASIPNVIIGTFLFQGIITLTPTVINGALNIDISEILRLIITNGMIVYALTRRNRNE